MSGTIRWYRSKSEPAKKGRVIQPTAAPITNLDAKAPDTLTNVCAYENAVAKVFAKIHIRNNFFCKTSLRNFSFRLPKEDPNKKIPTNDKLILKLKKSMAEEAIHPVRLILSISSGDMYRDCTMAISRNIQKPVQNKNVAALAMSLT